VNHATFHAGKIRNLQTSNWMMIDQTLLVTRSFNFRSFFPAENCELSQYDTKQLKMDNPAHFEQHTQFDYYERDAFSGTSPAAATPPAGFPAECLEVAQACTADGMEFTVKTPEGFYGRIYTYGFYDSCFYDGNGGTVNVLRISRGEYITHASSYDSRSTLCEL
jgi:hypothetical protein